MWEYDGNMSHVYCANMRHHVYILWETVSGWKQLQS